jgi:hypothetical protein
MSCFGHFRPLLSDFFEQSYAGSPRSLASSAIGHAKNCGYDVGSTTDPIEKVAKTFV